MTNIILEDITKLKEMLESNLLTSEFDFFLERLAKDIEIYFEEKNNGRIN